MAMKKCTLIIVLVIGLLSCTMQQNKKMGMLPLLSMNTIFDLDSVAQYLKMSPSTFKDSSQRIFLHGVNLLVNEKNAAGAAQAFVRALFIYPNAAGYYELGNAYLETGKFEAALSSFKMAEKLDYKPLNAVLFKQACCYAEQDDHKAYKYLSYAIENGFVNTERIFNEPHFRKIRHTVSFTETYNDAMSGNGNPDAILWEGYSKEFPARAFPLTIDTGSHRLMAGIDPISYDYEKFVAEMRDNKFSRDVGNEFFYFAKVASNDSVTAIVYGSRGYSEEYDGDPTYYYLAVFNNNGKLLDKKLIAGHKLEAEPQKVCTIKSWNNFEISEYENIYEKTKEEYPVNKLIKRNFIKTEKFKIDPSGKILLI
jgi:tetratricopeptide (TPR) repeat protein